MTGSAGGGGGGSVSKGAPARWSRRRVLEAGGVLAGASAASALIAPAFGRSAEPDAERRITFKNLHTPETLTAAFRRGGDYLPDALEKIQVILRDYRTGERHPIDPPLLDYLYDVALAAGADPVFGVISGFRSPRTNALLHERSSGVSSHSLHMEGRAIDVRLAGIDCAELAGHALAMKRGGVGYYRRSDFVHLDTGRFRSWRG
jgi:uncharacterized protein YcbK (DUF882 family)